MAIRDRSGPRVSHIQTKTPAEFDENFRQYGAKGFNLVFGHGFEFQDAALRVARDYPNTVYVTTSGTSVAKNVAGGEFAFEEASYLAGMVAGRMTKSDVLGMIGGTELPPVKRSFEAFEQGAKSVNPKVTGHCFLYRQLGRCERRKRAGAGADLPRCRSDLPERRCRRTGRVPGGEGSERRAHHRLERKPERHRT